jgi:pimeloyl-ACP methyl ester carboxylesterase
MADGKPRRRPYSSDPGEDRIGSLIEKFEDQVRKRPLPLDEAPAAAAREAEPAAQGAPMPEAVLQELRAELEAETQSPAQVPEPAAPAPPGPLEDLETWWAGGERVEVEVGSGKWQIFARVLGSGPWMTLVHGFPTCSWDWAKVAPTLAQHYRLLVFDHLGFGESDKPTGHDWSTFEASDIVEALWRRFGVTETRVVAHDLGLTVAIELMALLNEGKLNTRVTDFTVLNGGVYAGYHRPRPIQVWLQRPIVGAFIARRLSEANFSRGLAEVFSPSHQPSPEELHQHWLSVARRDGGRNYHRLIKYIPERRRNMARWESAVENIATPVKFVWGMADPVSGAHMATVIKSRRPGANIVELEDVGHYPQLEAPERVTNEILSDVK